MKNNRNKWVHIRVSQQEHLAWHTLAHDHNLSLADYIRQLLGDNKPTRRPTRRRSRTCHQVDPELLRAIARIGNNCNQLARWCNTYKRATEAVQVCAQLVIVQRQLAGLLKQQGISNKSNERASQSSEFGNTELPTDINHAD